jgi:hypothetical protein
MSLYKAFLASQKLVYQDMKEDIIKKHVPLDELLS